MPQASCAELFCSSHQSGQCPGHQSNSSKILYSTFVYVLFYVNLCTGLILWSLNNLSFYGLMTCVQSK